jgi:hypothetical protein
MKSKAIMIMILAMFTQVVLWGQEPGRYPLRAGAARVDITPPNEPTAPATGRYDQERGYARAIVLDNSDTRAAIITLDIAGFNIDSSLTDLCQWITDKLGCPLSNLIITPTHSHSSGAPTMSPKNRPPSQSISPYVNAIKEAVLQAQAKLQPASMAYGKGMSYLNVNRNTIERDTRKWTQASNMEATSDKAVDVLMFETPAGKPIAAYFTYAMHPVSGYVVGVYSTDFAGAACRYIEKAFGDDMIAAFSQGASGDQNPLYLRTSTNAMASRSGVEITGYEMKREPIEAPVRGMPDAPPVDPAVLDNLMRMIESEGQLLGEEVIRVMSTVVHYTTDVRIRGIQRTFTCPGRTRINFDMNDPAYREGVEAEYVDGPDVEHHLGILGLGTTVIAYSDGEIFSAIGQRIKRESPLTSTIFAELAFGRGVSYIPEDAAYGQQTFQVLNARNKPGCAENTLVDGISMMIKEYINDL